MATPDQKSIDPTSGITARLKNLLFMLIVASTFSARVSESFAVPPEGGNPRDSVQ